MKYLIAFLLVFVVGCGGKSVAPLEFDAGLPTLNNLSRGELNLSCLDARWLKTMFLSYDGVVLSYATLNIAYPQASYEQGFVNKEHLDIVIKEYMNFQERILAAYKGNPDAYSKVLTTVINTDMRNVFEASFYYYLGLMTESQTNSYIETAFCGGKRDTNFMSPQDVSREQFLNAVTDKLTSLKNKLK